MSKLPIISADQRLAEKRGIKGCILGKAGIGKTSLLWTLDTESTLFIDLEAGDLAVQGWSGYTLRPESWPQCRDLAVFLGGGNIALRSEQPYSVAHYDAVCKRFCDIKSLDKYETIFIDSITVAARLCLQWCKNQPQSVSERTGKEDMRATYGLHGQEMISWITHLQHIRAKNIWFVGILDEKLDDFNRTIFSMQVDGAKTGNELPAIVDQLITMAEIKTKDGASSRAFVNHTINPYGYPAKDRSGALELIEEPHLGKLTQKIKSKSNNKNKGDTK
ncbi:ATP-binding protein [Rickettsiaceae bacterium]|nr:ATP-binding protein [Rickettsiaceae bacterium]